MAAPRNSPLTMAMADGGTSMTPRSAKARMARAVSTPSWRTPSKYSRSKLEAAAMSMAGLWVAITGERA